MSAAGRYICFNLGSQEYGVPLLSIREVLGLPEVTPIPQTPSHFLGIMNLRGNVISVMDLRNKIGLNSNNTGETSVMIFDLGHYVLGVVVDKINAVITIPEADISERPVLESSSSTDYIENIYRNKDQLVLLISVAKALSLEDHEVLAHIEQQQKAA